MDINRGRGPVTIATELTLVDIKIPPFLDTQPPSETINFLPQRRSIFSLHNKEKIRKIPVLILNPCF